MKGIDLLKAMNNLDSELIQEAGKSPAPRKRSPRRLITVLVAVTVVASLAIGAAAAELGGGWFRRFFADKSQSPLSDSQIAYLDENAKTFAPTQGASQPSAPDASQRQTQDGYTMELKSAITDGHMAYVVIGITAPEDVVLNATTIEGYNPEKPSLRPGNSGELNFLTDENGAPLLGFTSWEPREDYDGLANTQDLVIKILPDEQDSFGASMVWNLHFEDLIAQYFNEAYQTELPDNYISFDDETYAKLFPKVTLAKGTWDFKVDFSGSDMREIELISQPVLASACTGWKESGEKVYQEVEVTSFVLRSLSASIYTSWHDGAPDFSDVYAVMKDGSRITLTSNTGSSGEENFCAESPILLDEVDHILLIDGTELPMP